VLSYYLQIGLKHFSFYKELSEIYIRLHIKHSLFLSDFNQTRMIPTYFRKKPSNIKFMKIHPVGAELFRVGGRTDRETDMTKLTVACRHFTNWINHTQFGINLPQQK